MIDFKEVDVKEYLDSRIRTWRWMHEGSLNEDEKHTATCYIDAYQSIRMSLFGDALHNEEGENVIEV